MVGMSKKIIPPAIADDGVQSILDMFSYDDWETGDDERLRVGDCLYAHREVGMYLREESFYARVQTFDMTVSVSGAHTEGRLPVLLLGNDQTDSDAGDITSVLEAFLQGWSFTRINRESYDEGIAEMVGA